MARPHIMFIQAQDIPWVPGLPSGARPEVESRTLSIDEAGTDCTLLVRYPAGWSAGPEYVDCLEEFVVIDGWIEINGVRYDRQSYGCLPAFYPRHRAVALEGAVLLAMYHDRPTVHSGTPPRPYDPALLVEHVDPLAMEWDPGLVDPQLAAGVAIKPLRTDPVTGETSFFYMSPPHRVPPGMAKPQWTHSIVEELYCLQGEYVWGDSGRMGPGGYAWWREHEYHGPSGTDTGYLLFVRTVNGPLDNIFDTEKKPFTWNPAFNPTLPPELKAIARPYERVKSY
jgi:hypothetical protein